jgi:hypothetical protein
MTGREWMISEGVVNKRGDKTSFKGLIKYIAIYCISFITSMRNGLVKLSVKLITNSIIFQEYNLKIYL